MHVLLEFLVGGIVDAAAAHGAEGALPFGRGAAEAFTQAGTAPLMSMLMLFPLEVGWAGYAGTGVKTGPPRAGRARAAQLARTLLQ